MGENDVVAEEMLKKGRKKKEKRRKWGFVMQNDICWSKNFNITMFLTRETEFQGVLRYC